MNTTFTEFQLNDLYDWLNLWVFVVSLGVLLIEGIRLALRKTLSWNLLGDAVTNFITSYGSLAITILLLSALYVGGLYLVYEYFSVVQLPLNGWTLAGCILLADFAYYWEHRATHRLGIGWATHTVHHSSPYFNISVAYRFGPLDGFFPIFFHLPLAALGFNPMLIIVSEAIVLLYQTFLHTETIGKLPKPVEAIMNTPSHHRVHHGMNPEYIDKNYGGMFIVWDRLFGTFAEEREQVIYGITDQIESINPLTVFFHGLVRLGKKMLSARRLTDALAYLVKPPGWEPADATRPAITEQRG